ncbi:MAG: CocE/NonD family hydrolase C-terminal non-catalytic domain-containing protein [Planctomycetota bacterium]
MNAISSLTLGLALAASTPAATDPPAPPGGFPIQRDLDQPIAYSDGYQTALDLRYPSVAAPTNGWPCALVIHGGGGSRKRSWVQNIAEQLAAAGYVTLAYDTGNEGITQFVNPPGTRQSDERIRDMAEIVYRAEQFLGQTLDETRLAVMGKSGGGRHALWAAAYSGDLLPTGGAFVNRMPTISAIHTDIQTIDAVTDRLQQGAMINAKWAIAAYDGLGPLDPLVQAMAAGDYAALDAGLRAGVGSGYFPLLQQSDVPMLVSYAFDDAHHFVNDNPDLMRQLKPGVPRRFYLATGGHGSANNNGVGTTRRDVMQRWFDRFLKGIPNGVDLEAAAEVALLPAAPGEYLNPNSHWQHRRLQSWPLAPTQTRYLRGSGRLETTPPTGIEAGPIVRHRVAPGYDMLSFMADGAGPNVLTNVPLVTAGFDTPPFGQAQELLGRTVVELDVIVSARDCQLQAALIDVAPGGQERFVTSGVAALRDVVPGRHRLRIEVGDVGYIVPAGHRLRLSLENMSLRRQPGHQDFLNAPDFVDCDIDVQIDPAFPPRVDLPIGPVRPSLTPRMERVSASAAFAAPLHVDAGTQQAGSVYQVLLSASGTWPGLALPGTQIPLSFDAWTSVGLLVGNAPPLFTDFVGVLDANGQADASFGLPALLAPTLIGERFAFSALGYDGTQFFATNPVELSIEP